MISVIIPTYNAEKYISETIQSVISQTFKDWELIIVDDGSSDRSSNLIKELSETEPRINYLYQENAGVSKARNKGLEKASGDIIALLDADDLWHENKLEIVSEIFDRNEVDWTFSDVLEFEINGKEHIKKLDKSNDFLKSLLLWDGKVLTAPSGIVFKKSCFDKGCKFDPNFSTAADQDFAIQLASKYKGFHIPQVLWSYRILENSMCRNIELMEKDHTAVYQKAEVNQLFYSYRFKKICFSNLYWILAGSWWVNGANKKRGLYYILKGILNNPVSLTKLINKI